MQKDILTIGNQVLSVDDNGRTTSLVEAVGILAISTYEDYAEISQIADEKEKKRLIDKITYQSNLLDSLSNALLAISTVKTDY